MVKMFTFTTLLTSTNQFLTFLLMNPIRSVFVASGCYLPEQKITNAAFLSRQFYDTEGRRLEQDNGYIVKKFEDITEIQERCYALPEQRASDLAFLAANDALQSSFIDPETLDYIIVAHNFGDITSGTHRTELVPSLATRVKHLLQIKNPDCVAYDMAFGCPGWLEAVIQANYFLTSGDARRAMVIGAETLSRVIDPHDRDSMLYSDGAGAVIMEAFGQGERRGILSHKSQTHAGDQAWLLHMEHSYNSDFPSDDIFMHMNGRKLYEFALKQVPQVIHCALDRANLHLKDIDKVLIHQANGKMDTAILNRLFSLYGMENLDKDIMPMTISWLGNSSVATVPTLLDLIQKGKLEQKIEEGNKVVLASVGAGMNINALVYQF